MAAVRHYVDAFNTADSDAMAATCADPMQILDGMAPHVWQGPTASQDWWRDVLTEGDHLGASGYHIALGEPRHVDITGDNAYVAEGHADQADRRDVDGGATPGWGRVAADGVGVGERRVRLGSEEPCRRGRPFVGRVRWSHAHSSTSGMTSPPIP